MLPTGFVARPIALERVDGFLDGPDVDLVFSVVHACELALLDDVDSTRETVRFQLASPETVLDEAVLVHDPQGAPAGVLLLECEESASRIFLDAYVVPGSPLQAALIEAGIAAAQRISDRHGDPQGRRAWEIEAACHTTETEYAAELINAGFTRVRRFWRMTIDLVGYPQEMPPAPSGVHLTRAAGEGDRRLVHRIHTAAFSDHFGSVARPFEEWIRWHDESKDTRPDLWWIGWLNDVPVAHITQDDSRAEFGAAYIRSIGVLPEARGHGIARWLLRSAFAEAAAAGRTSALLAVDSENTTGATALYESVGMRPTQVIDVFRRPL